MKKYIAPATEILSVQTQQMIAASVGIDPDTQTNQNLSRRRGRSSLWDDEEEDEDLY